MSANAGTATERTDKRPSTDEQAPGTYLQVEGDRGIYRYKDTEGKITYHERPWVAGKRTWRSLGFAFTAQSSLKLAREEYHRRRAEVSVGRNPYAEAPQPAVIQNPTPAESGAGSQDKGETRQAPAVGGKLTVAEILTRYRDAGFPDKYLQTRTGRTLELEHRNCSVMLEFFNGEAWDDLLPPVWDKYKEWRVQRIPERDLKRIEKEKQRKKAGLPRKKKKTRKKEKCTKHRTVDQERNTMRNAYKFAIRKGWIDINRANNLPRFQPASEVQHCREFCPTDANELHNIAKLLFAHRSSEVLGWQLLFEAYTGHRTEEVLMLRTDAKPGQTGFIRADGNMDVFRTKKGANPYVFIHDGLTELIKAHATWKEIRYPKSPWFFPGRDEPNRIPVDKGALGHGLRRLRRQIGRKITSHGMRAFYVLIRRSHGIGDPCIAWEIGHTSGGLLIAQVYGTVPSSWLNGGGPKLKWLPDGQPAWKSIPEFTTKRFRDAAPVNS